ncbi:pentatricopeptide repeat-containing protein At1g12775, mitochondrial-like [Pistacia vera]|uniref:pentatricopeptide repeat-containing protein At1g12775, mitochondrial-like n=1 Tax=Pistacia vera TaxID=55513 RepID=UPI001263398D|nr:pentatricopeptide repeat-containing protein At1g12775, mitochondrial-like [Pistacia vera]
MPRGVNGNTKVGGERCRCRVMNWSTLVFLRGVAKDKTYGQSSIYLKSPLFFSCCLFDVNATGAFLPFGFPCAAVMLILASSPDRIRHAITCIAEELEVEKKLRRQTERLNKKLGKELAETKSSLSTTTKELEIEKRAKEILEQVRLKVIELLRKMGSFVVRLTIIDGLCKYGLIDKAKELFSEMKTRALIQKLFLQNGKMDEANGLLQLMINRGVHPNNNLNQFEWLLLGSCLIDGLCKTGRLKIAWELFHRLRNKALFQMLCNNILMMDFVKREIEMNNETSKVVELLHKMNERNLKLDASIASIIVDLLGRMKIISNS